MVNFQAVCRSYLARRLYRKRLDQARAIITIQKNARAYIQLREWAWWKLFTKVKPLLNITRIDEELRKKEQYVKQLEAKARQEAEEREQLSITRDQLEQEKREIEEILLSERHAQIDQQEILKRTQQRELDLEESLR